MSLTPRRLTPACALAIALLLAGGTMPAAAQGWKDRLKKTVGSTVEKRVDKDAEKAANASVDAVEGAVKCAVDDQKCIADAKKAGKPVVLTDDKGNPIHGSASEASAVAASGPSVNFDYVPGSKVLFQDDFSHDPLNDLPTRVKVESGNVQIADVGGQKMLVCTSSCWLMIPLPETLPEKFTLEAEVRHSMGWTPHLHFVPDPQREKHQAVLLGSDPGIGNFRSHAEITSKQPYILRIMADGGHAKVYANSERTANVPEANLGRSNAVWLYGPGDKGEPFYLSSIRIAASERSLFDALSAEGRAVTHGILFATGKADIQPESAPTLKEIVDMLVAHPELKLTIEGHTDNVGKPADNLALSDRRAASVKQYLVENFHVDASRLATKGFGDTKPVAPNDSDAGRQQNRRVELVKM